jgi:phosphoglycolate phosphatase
MGSATWRKRLPRLVAVLIDLDGTLMDTAPDLAAAVNRLRRDFGLPDLSTPRIAAFVGKGARALIHRALTDDLDGRVEDSQYARAQELFYRHYHEVNGAATVVFEGVPEALRMLREADLRLACVTNKPREFTVPLLDRLHLASCFSIIVAGDDVKETKPHPELLLTACDRLEVDAGAAIMIGDSINDVLAARAAGMPVVLVETGYNEGDSVAVLRGEPGVEAVVPTLFEAAQYLIMRQD